MRTYIVRTGGAACCLSLRVYINVRADRLAHTLPVPGYSTLVIRRRIVQVHSKMKMLKVVVFALFAFLLVAVRGSPLQHKLEDVTIIELEESCVLQGGLCVRSDDCDPENFPLLGANLCPKQRHLGVTCCYM